MTKNFALLRLCVRFTSLLVLLRNGGISQGTRQSYFSSLSSSLCDPSYVRMTRIRVTLRFCVFARLNKKLCVSLRETFVYLCGIKITPKQVKNILLHRNLKCIHNIFCRCSSIKYKFTRLDFPVGIFLVVKSQIFYLHF